MSVGSATPLSRGSSSIWLTALFALIMGGCSGSETEPSTTGGGTPGPSTTADNDGEVSYQPEDQPVYRLLYDRLGLSSSELRGLAESARLNAFLSCMGQRGFDMPADAAIPIVRLPAPSLSPVDEGIAQVKSEEAMRDRDIPEQQMGACLIDIDLINPFNDLVSLLDDQTAAISERVRTDPRYRVALDASAMCSSNPASTDNRRTISDQVQQIVMSYSNGGTSAAETLHLLEQLRGAASQVDWSTEGGCDADLMVVERALVSEYQQRFLDENPGFISGVVDEFGPIVDKYLAGDPSGAGAP